MADRKLTDPALPELTGANLADADRFYVVDVSDATDDPAGTSKWISADSVVFAANTGRATLRPRPGMRVLISGFESGAVEGGTGTTTHDTTIFASGAASAKSVAPVGTTAFGPRVTFSAQDWSNDAFAAKFRFDTFAQITDGYVLVSTSGVFASYWQYQIKPDMLRVVDGEWYDFEFGQGQFTVGAGTPDWATVNGVYFQFFSSNGVQPTMWVDQLTRTRRQTKPLVSIVFDDGFATTRTEAKKVLDNAGMRASTMIIPSLVGTASYMTQNQVDELAVAGWDIGGHGATDLTTLSATAAEADVKAMKKWLADRGYKGQDTYALPLGGHNDAVRKIVAKYFGFSRSTKQGTQTIHNVNPESAATRQPGSTWVLSDFQTHINRAIANNEWLILTFHALRDPTQTSEDVTPTMFADVINYLGSSGAEVVTLSEAIARTAEAEPGPLVGVATINFGSSPSNERSFDIADAGALVGQRIIASISADPTSGRDADEVECDPILVAAHVPTNGTVRIYAMPLEGRVAGAYKVNYQAV